MTERLKQLSLRKFRETIVDVHEVVEVSRRDPEGNIQILGFWTPYVTYPAGSIAIHPSTMSAEALNAGASGEVIDYVDPTDGTYDPETEVWHKVGEPVALDIPVDDAFPVAEDSEFDRHPLTAKVINTPEEAAVAVRPHPVLAVPKPSQRGRKR